jgi:hypothetical protein
MTRGYNVQSLRGYDTPGKAAYREDVANFLWDSKKQGARLWDKGKEKLVVKVVDLAGPSADETVQYFVHDKQIVPEDGLIFVDDDGKNISKFQPEFPKATWIHGNLFDLLHDVRLADVGVLLVDGCHEVGDQRIASQLPNMHGLIRRGIERSGAFALMINCCLDTVVRRGRGQSKALREWADILAQALSGYYPRRMLDPERLLPNDGSADVLDKDSKFTNDPGSSFGSFFISRSHVHRMANFRILLV